MKEAKRISMEKGMEKGIMEERRKIIYNLRKQQLSIEVIMAVTGLTAGEIDSF